MRHLSGLRRHLMFCPLPFAGETLHNRNQNAVKASRFGSGEGM